MEDEQIVLLFKGESWILGCNATVYDATYTWVNGSVNTLSAAPANDSLGGAFAGPFAAGLAQSTLENAVILTRFAKSSPELAKTWLDLFSRSTVAIASGIMAPDTNIEEESRQTRLLARIPKAPLFLLLGLNFLCAIAGLILDLAAAMFSRPVETQDVKARLTMKGLAAAAFEPDGLKHRAVENVEDLFVERGSAGEGKRRPLGRLGL